MFYLFKHNFFHNKNINIINIFYEKCLLLVSGMTKIVKLEENNLNEPKQIKSREFSIKIFLEHYCHNE